MIVEYKDSSARQTVYVTDVNKAADLAGEYKIPCSVEDVRESGGGLLSSVMPWLGSLLLILLMFWMINRMSAAGGNNGKMMNFGKSRARMLDPSARKTTFSDVAGLKEEKEELEEIVDFLKDPGKYTRMGARIPAGVLLVGPPGTGKTSFSSLIRHGAAGSASMA